MKNIGIDLGSRYVKLVKESNGSIEYNIFDTGFLSANDKNITIIAPTNMVALFMTPLLKPAKAPISKNKIIITSSIPNIFLPPYLYI